jgi:dTDP-4-amino-4,6-dideoxy-D-galactose acyltransferase
MNSIGANLCEFLPWDSSFFGFRIARLTAGQVTSDSMAAAVAWCGSQQIECLYFLADPDDRESLRAAESAGFEQVGIRTTLSRPAGALIHLTQPDHVRRFQPADLERLKAIARQSHRDSRFFFDGRFAEDRCEALYERWIERSCEGWAQSVFVAHWDGLVAGYCTCHIDDEGTGSIGLIAVDANAQGCGLGRELMDASLLYFQQQDVARVKVVSQGGNARAQRFYLRSGFGTDSIRVWYHKWFQ